MEPLSFIMTSDLCCLKTKTYVQSGAGLKTDKHRNIICQDCCRKTAIQKDEEQANKYAQINFQISK